MFAGTRQGFSCFLSKAADAVTVVDADADADAVSVSTAGTGTGTAAVSVSDAVSVSGTGAGAAAVFKSGSATRKLKHACGNTTEGRLNGVMLDLKAQCYNEIFRSLSRVPRTHERYPIGYLILSVLTRVPLPLLTLGVFFAGVRQGFKLRVHHHGSQNL